MVTLARQRSIAIENIRAKERECERISKLIGGIKPTPNPTSGAAFQAGIKESWCTSLLAFNAAQAKPVTKLTESIKDEVQFFTQPTTVFESVGVMADPIRILGAPSQVAPSFNDQVFFLTAAKTTYSLTGFVRTSVNIRIRDPSRFSDRDTTFYLITGILGTNNIGLLAKTTSFRVNRNSEPVTLNLTIDLKRGRSTPDFIVVQHFIAPSSQGLLKVSSVTSQTIPRETQETEFRDCDCCTGFDNASTRRIPRNQPCPACGKCENGGNGPDFTPNIFDKGIVALLAVAALIPRGRKK